MKFLFICAALMSGVYAAEQLDIEDLGALTSRTALVLEKDTTRPDWSHFVIELLPQTPPTNLVTLIHTNVLLKVSDLGKVPSGPVLMGLRSVCKDGSESDIHLLRFDLRRAGPPRPWARRIYLNDPGTNKMTLPERIRRHRKELPVKTPPTPGQTNSASLRPMPGGRDETYAEHLDKMVEFYASRVIGRRNEQ